MHAYGNTRTHKRQSSEVRMCRLAGNEGGTRTNTQRGAERNREKKKERNRQRDREKVDRLNAARSHALTIIPNEIVFKGLDDLQGRG